MRSLQTSEKKVVNVPQFDRVIGVVGLGLMGTAMTERLLEHGFRVRVWNRSPEKAELLIAAGAEWSDNPFSDCDRVIISLYTTEVVEQVIEQLSVGLRAGLLLLDTTTGEPEMTAALGTRLGQLGVRYLDAPISGSSEQTRRGEATVMVGGHRSDFAACEDLWPILGHKTSYCGPCGSAAKMKLVSNLVLGLNRAALAEGLSFGSAIGLEPQAVLDVLRGSMAASRIMDTKGRKMIERDYAVQARLTQHLKDVRLMLDAAERLGLSLPLSAAHAELLEQAEAAGFGAVDNSAIIEAYRGRDTEHG